MSNFGNKKLYGQARDSKDTRRKDARLCHLLKLVTTLPELFFAVLLHHTVHVYLYTV